MKNPQFCFSWLYILFVWGFSSHSRTFPSYGDINITSEWLQILTYTRHLWPLRSEGSLACHTYCDTGHPLVMVIFENPWHLHLAITERFALELSLLFLRLMLNHAKTGSIPTFPFLNIWYSFLQGGGGKVSHSNGDVIIADEGLTIFTYIRNSWLLSIDLQHRVIVRSTRFPFHCIER